MSERERTLERARSAVACAPLPDALAGVDRALRIPVTQGDDRFSVVVRAVGGTLAVLDGARVATSEVPVLSQPMAAADLIAWCTDPDRLLGELVAPEDLTGDVLFLVS